MCVSVTLCVCVCVCLCSSGPSGAAEVALQHQPPAAEPPSAHEGGGRRGGEGQSSAHTTSQGSRFVAPLKSSLCPEAEAQKHYQVILCSSLQTLYRTYGIGLGPHGIIILEFLP